MKKIRLAVETLEVETFELKAPEGRPAGTVHAHVTQFGDRTCRFTCAGMASCAYTCSGFCTDGVEICTDGLVC